MSEESEDAVGYGKPPIKHRFGQGQSRNRQGRPRGAKNTRTIVHTIAHERHLVKEEGQTKSYTTAELLLITLLRKTMKGDVRASRILDKYRAAYQLEQGETPGGFLVVREPMTEDEWMLHVKASNARREYLDSQESDNGTSPKI